jgi:hypothetical protein
MVSTDIAHAQQNGLSNRIAPLQKMLIGRPSFDGEYWHACAAKLFKRIASLQKMLVGRPSFDGEYWHA